MCVRRQLKRTRNGGLHVPTYDEEKEKADDEEWRAADRHTAGKVDEGRE